MTADVFVSYSREDLPRVKPLVGMLEAQGWSVFWDRQILPGQQWSNLLAEKLAAAKAVVVVWSRSSVQSEWVKAEAMEARERGILVPVRIDPTPIPLPFGLIQTADLDPAKSSEADETVHLLMTHLSHLIALPLTNTKAALQFAATAAPSTGSRAGGTDWKQVLLELDGRINRKFYWIGILVLLCLGFFLDFIAEAMVRVTRPELAPIDVAYQANVLGFFVFLYPNIVISVKRLHDFNWSGWWAAPLMVGSFIATAFSASAAHGGSPEEVAVAWFALVIFGLAPIVAIGLIRGTPEANTYGPPPP